MTSAHQEYIERAFADYKTQTRSDLADGRLFIRYSAHLVLQRPPFDIGDEALEDGVVDGSLDGGVDAVYTLFNGEPLESDSDVVVGDIPAVARQGTARLDVIVLQTKLHGVGTTAVEKLQANLPRLMDLSNPALSSEEFNELVLDRFEIARKAWANLAGYNCVLNFTVLLTTLSDVDPISQETERKLTSLRASLENSLPGVSSVVAAVEGARPLITRQRAVPPSEYTIAFEKHFPSGSGVVTLVRLGEYSRFIDDGSGRVAVRLLEDNVRDWQGEVEVNTAIRGSLERSGETPFWWLNNGVTMVCTSVTAIGEALKVVQPRIVNGLQTTRVIHNYLSEHPDSDAANDLLLVRFVMIEDGQQRDAVIRATNSQTNVDPASLRATDMIQRHIEDHLVREEIFYDRRKGSFRDNQRAGQKMLSIRDMGQALTAMLLARPDLARGRPTSLLKDNERYASLFSDQMSLDLYLLAARLWLHVGEVLQSDEASMSSVERRYLRLHVLSAVVSIELRHWTRRGADLNRLASSKWLPTKDEVLAAATIVHDEVAGFINEEQTNMEKATKAQGFTNRLAARDWSGGYNVSPPALEVEQELPTAHG